VPLADTIRDRLAAIEAQGRRRSLVPLDDRGPVQALVGGREVVVFCSNDYLGLRRHPAVIEAAHRALDEHGAGSGSSRLIAGTLPPHGALEGALAERFGAPAALLLSSGYHANLAVLTTLAGRGDTIASDTLNHASIVDGCRLSRAEARVFDHGDAAALARLLAAPGDGERWVVAEGLYSMDGDVIDLAGYAREAARAGAHLVVDEAHSLGALGDRGRGACHAQGVVDQVAVRVGTLGKALGSAGAFVLCDHDTRDLLVSSARSLLYTTAPPRGAAAAALAALQVLDAEPQRVQRLQRNAERVWRGVADLGLRTSPAPTAIVPVVVGAEGTACAVADRLLARGFYVRAIRPPTVPPQTCRVRISLSAEHTTDQIDALLEALDDAVRGAPPETPAPSEE